MRINDPNLLKGLAELGVELRPAARLSDLTSLGIGGTTDLLRITKHESIPGLLNLLDANHIPHKFLGGGSNLLVDDGELPWVVLQLASPNPASSSKAISHALMPPRTSAAPSPSVQNTIRAVWK